VVCQAKAESLEACRRVYGSLASFVTPANSGSQSSPSKRGVTEVYSVEDGASLRELALLCLECGFAFVKLRQGQSGGKAIPIGPFKMLTTQRDRGYSLRSF
jgi:hypothetical protein